MGKVSEVAIELDELGEKLVNYIIQNERDRILQGIQELEDQSHATRTPLYQETIFAKIRDIVNANTR
jgi:hypothetical protein